jgi:hypothetical protein
MEVDRDSHAIKGVLAVITADDEKRLGAETLTENLGKCLGNPLQPWLVSGVVKGEDENGARASGVLRES